MDDFPRYKRELISGLDERRAETRAFVDRLPPDLPVHDSSDWTVRDLIIHLTALEADMIVAMQNAMEDEDFSVDLRGRSTAPELYELRRTDKVDRSWEELLLEWERVRDQLRGMVLAFPVEKMQTAFSTPFFQDYDLMGAVGACGAHERAHLAEMRAAAERRDE